MKIAVTYENGQVFQHFGHTEQFKLYDVEDGKIVREAVVGTNGSGHGALAGFLTLNGVDALICGGIGGGAQTALAEAGIKLYGGVSGDADAAVNALRTQNTRYPVVVSWQYSFDSGSPDEAQIAFLRDMMGTFADNREGLVYASYTVESIASNREDFVGTYGSLFFLAILLSIVFLAAAVLILYYKQISEGYEDQARFEIMQRVGMTKTDIRKSINSQLLLVFFLPLLFAGLHLGFAFPFVHKMLMLFNLTNLKLLIGTTVVTFAIYAVFYTLVYRITSNSYYSIVAGAKEEAA